MGGFLADSEGEDEGEDGDVENEDRRLLTGKR